MIKRIKGRGALQLNIQLTPKTSLHCSQINVWNMPITFCSILIHHTSNFLNIFVEVVKSWNQISRLFEIRVNPNPYMMSLKCTSKSALRWNIKEISELFSVVPPILAANLMQFRTNTCCITTDDTLDVICSCLQSHCLDGEPRFLHTVFCLNSKREG